MKNVRTQVGIVGAGPAGLFLAHQLLRAGIETVILESRSREYVEGRVRAGLLEHGTVSLMEELGLAERLHREAAFQDAISIRFSGRSLRFDLTTLTPGKKVTLYGQQEVVKDLLAGYLGSGGTILFEAQATAIDGLDDKPRVHFTRLGEAGTLDCELLVGCDGFHGISRAAIPPDALTLHDRQLPFGWLGVLSHSAPLPHVTYAHHDRGFALCTRRTPRISRCYLQCKPDENLDEWSDSRFWSELRTRMNDDEKGEIFEGEIFQKAVAPIRAFVCAPMQYKNLFLAGDAAHIVPPTGAKGLNLAVADVRILAAAMVEFFRTGDRARMDGYSAVALKRVWKIMRYSFFMTALLHRFEEHSPFERQIQLAELDYLASSRAAATALAENFVGLPIELE